MDEFDRRSDVFRARARGVGFSRVSRRSVMQVYTKRVRFSSCIGRYRRRCVPSSPDADDANAAPPTRSRGMSRRSEPCFRKMLPVVCRSGVVVDANGQRQVRERAPATTAPPFRLRARRSLSPAVCCGLMPTPSSVMMAEVAAGTLNSSAAKRRTAVKGASSGTVKLWGFVFYLEGERVGLFGARAFAVRRRRAFYASYYTLTRGTAASGPT
jgi:hypothetical protein